MLHKARTPKRHVKLHNVTLSVPILQLPNAGFERNCTHTEHRQRLSVLFFVLFLLILTMRKKTLFDWVTYDSCALHKLLYNASEAFDFLSAYHPL